MRIGIDARFYGPTGGGGLGRYTKELVDNLEQIDDKNQYVIFLRRENWDDYNPTHPNFKKVLAPYKWYSWREQIFLPFKIWREKVDLMHFPHFNTPILYVYNVNLFEVLSKYGWIKKIFTRNNTKLNTKPHENECNTGFILTVHDLILLKYPSKKATTLAPIYFKLKFRVYKIVIRSALKRACKVIVPSEYVKKDIIKYFNIHPEKIVVIYEGVTKVDKENGFGENRFVENRIMNHKLGIMNGKECKEGEEAEQGGISNFKFQISKEEKDKKLKMWYNKNNYILYVGNAYPHKNLEQLVNAFAVVIKDVKDGIGGEKGKEGEEAEEDEKIKYKLKLVIVGVKNYFYERVETYAEKNFPDLKDRIIFFGYATDKELADLYRNAALYVFPSLEEGFGLPPLEAMSYGVPVVSSDKSCLSEILGDAVLYFNAESKDDIADKILRGLEDKNLREELIKKGYERIKLYDWGKNVRRTRDIYNKAVEE